MSFQSPVDIGNQALQFCGAKRVTALTDNSKNAAAVNFCYDQLRRAELRRNVWTFAVRRAVLRPTGVNTMTLVPATWLIGTTYALGALVTSGNRVWQSEVASNLANTPSETSTQWQLYFGPTTYEPWDSTIAYYAGEVVYLDPAWAVGTTYANGAVVAYGTNADGSTTLWQSQGSGNIGNTPGLNTAYWDTVSEPITNAASMVPYLSLVSNNSGTPGASSLWLALSGTVSFYQPLYPAGAGPSNDRSTRNVFLLPIGFLKEAPQDPKAGATSFLGAPTGRFYSDWTLENGKIISRDPSPIILRFAADIVNVPSMDPMFCMGFAARIAATICEEVTQSTAKLGSIKLDYRSAMVEARLVNGIEQGPTEPPEDDYITCRI